MTAIIRTYFLLILSSALFSACRNKDSGEKKSRSGNTQKQADKIYSKRSVSEILIQPFSDLPASRATFIFEKARQIFTEVKLLPAINLPSSAFYKPRNRYRADSLIHWLRSRISVSQVIVGITSKDISTTKGTNPDSGVFGLGFMNGPSSMVSDYRLRKRSNEQLLKTVLHELGHNFGLDHCPEKTCYMRDAEGRNPLDEEKGFCVDCREKLIAMGWNL